MKFTKDILHRMYVVEQKSMNAIAAEMNSHRETVRQALIRHGIPARKPCAVYPTGRKHFITEEYLRREYTENGKTQEEIAKMLGCGSTLVFNAMKEYGIPTRPRETHLKGRKQSLEHRMNNAKSHLGVTAGEKNPKWKGGISTDHAAIRRRSEHNNWRNWILRIKGDFCEQCGKDLNARCSCCDHKPDKHVHHIKDFANHPELRSDPNNGLVLCESCHRKLHTK